MIFIVRKNRKKTQGDDTFTDDDKYIIVDKEKIIYPTLDKVINKNVQINLMESSNIII